PCSQFLSVANGIRKASANSCCDMCNCRRIARTSGTSTTCTRAPALLPRANSTASVRPWTRSLPNLLMTSSLSPIFVPERRRERPRLLFLVRRHVLAPAEVGYGRIPRADQVTNGLVRLIGYPHFGELARTKHACQLLGVASVGLDPVD